MIEYGKQRSTVKPEPMEMAEEKVFVYSDITEVSEEGADGQEGFSGYEFTLTEYSKDEYITLLSDENKVFEEKIALLSEQNTVLAEESTNNQMALCEIYEMIG